MKYAEARRVRAVVSLIAIIGATHGLVAHSQQRTAPTAAARGTGVIAGTITGADSGRGLRRAQVILSNAETRAAIATTTTDADVRFRIGAVPARIGQSGRFSIRFPDYRLPIVR